MHLVIGSYSYFLCCSGFGACAYYVLVVLVTALCESLQYLEEQQTRASNLKLMSECELRTYLMAQAVRLVM